MMSASALLSPVSGMADVLDWLCIVSKFSTFPDEDSLATVLEGGVGIGGIVPEGGISIVNLGLLDDDKPIFCRFC